MTQFVEMNLCVDTILETVGIVNIQQYHPDAQKCVGNVQVSNSLKYQLICCYQTNQENHKIQWFYSLGELSSVIHNVFKRLVNQFYVKLRFLDTKIKISFHNCCKCLLIIKFNEQSNEFFKQLTFYENVVIYCNIFITCVAK